MRRDSRTFLGRTTVTAAVMIMVVSAATASAAPYSSRNTLSPSAVAEVEQEEVQAGQKETRARGFDDRAPDTRAERFLQELQKREDLTPDEHYFVARRWLPRVH